MNWSDEYRLARRCLFGGKDQPQDLEQAFTLFQQEAQKGNALAMHDLGRMLADGLGRKIDMQAAHVWYSKALAAFYAVERQKKKRYAEYRIGKLYAAGLGCEQDYKACADDRVKLQRIRKAVEQGEFDILLVFMYDQLGRNLNETPFIAEWFTKKGIHVWSVYEGEIIDAVDAERMLDYIRFWQTDEAQKL